MSLKGIKRSRRFRSDSQQQADVTVSRVARKAPLHNMSSLGNVKILASDMVGAMLSNSFSFFRKKNAPPVEDSAGGGMEQPLVVESLSPTKQGSLSVGWLSHVGCVRELNEDALITLTMDFQQGDEHACVGVFAVADGMGGHAQGEKASAMAARIAANKLLQSFVIPTINGDDNSAPMYETMNEAILSAHAQVQEKLPGAGTTLTLAVIVDNSLAIAHVGDTRAYLYTAGQLKQITSDHSLVQRLVDIGHLTLEEAAHDPRRNVLHRALGQADTLEVDFQFRTFEPGDRLLICSDGLWGQLNITDIERTLRDATNPQLACQTLVQLANEAGGPDNITVIFVINR